MIITHCYYYYYNINEATTYTTILHMTLHVTLAERYTTVEVELPK